MKNILFIDRDGTLIQEPKDDFQVDNLEKLEFLPGVFKYLSKICEELEFELVMVSNQDGLGSSSFPTEDFEMVQNKMLQAFKNEGIEFTDIFIDKSREEDGMLTRKPGTAMLGKYIYGNYNLQNSFVIGDRLSDVQLAKNLSSKSILIGKQCDSANYCVEKWKEIYTILKNTNRKSRIERKTKETEISIMLDLDGSGESSIKTGIGFFDHMLEQLPRHGYFDLEINANGDLNVDEHHTIEDVGLVLGEAIKEALGTKKGIQRYGFTLPMDDSLAQVVLDFGGRPYLNWYANFKREMLGSMPTEMLQHFFKSFTDAAKCNLNIQVVGDNDHHKAESIFKAFAKSIGMAIERNNSGVIPSTKGEL
jgi:imidazoleglycerol-phosphate dehydratase/histidinol-phosphatase